MINLSIASTGFLLGLIFGVGGMLISGERGKQFTVSRELYDASVAAHKASMETIRTLNGQLRRVHQAQKAETKIDPH